MKQITIAVIGIIIFSFSLFSQTKDTGAKVKAPDGIQIVDAKLGTDVKDRVVVGEDSSFTIGSKIWLWVKVTGAANDSLTATWKCGNYSKDTKLGVGGSPWRTWTAKTASKAGDWTVSIADSKGNSLKELNFKVK